MKTIDMELRLDELRKWTLSVIEALTHEGALDAAAASMREAVESSFARRDLKGLRMAGRDLLEMCTMAPLDVWRRMDMRVRGTCGRGLSEEQEEAEKAFRRILDRGRIRNEREYRVVLATLDDTAAVAEFKGERAKMETILGEFEARILNRQRLR